MGRYPKEKSRISRRAFLGGLRWAPIAFFPAPLYSRAFRNFHPPIPNDPRITFPFADYRLTPQYPKKSPLDDVLRYVAPGTDQYITEGYANEISQVLAEWSEELRKRPTGVDRLAKTLNAPMHGARLIPTEEKKLRSEYGVEVRKRAFSRDTSLDRERFLDGMRGYLADFARIVTAEFQITEIAEEKRTPVTVRTQIRYDLVGSRRDETLEERIGYWSTDWQREDTGAWRVLKWAASEETLSRVRQPVFVDVSSQALGHVDSYKTQLLCGVDYWRTVLDGATGIDVYGNNGVAAGDYDHDGLDDLYISQPPGLPNRLYRNRGDGTFEDVTEAAGVGVLDGTACALFADFENKGLQDLLVVCANGPLLFVNQGNGTFSLKQDAFRFLKVPEGTFTHAAVADYDGDGRLDIYFCLYSYYLGLDQYHYPAPYFDARNGPPNFLLHNEGNGIFADRTEAAGLNSENDRYSFACAWGTFNSDGHPDLYVANDFGRSNLYRNNGDGTFAAVSNQTHANDVGAGMSVCWLDFDNDGSQDIYVSNMWSAAGSRVTSQASFQEKEQEEVRANYSRHMRGNWLYRNLGNGRFENASMAAGVEMGRWAWGSDSWDFDHDGYPDLYIANGYISGAGRDVASFFWRQVVGNSPATETASESYERGWNAINELIRSDATWNGYERNVFYRNNQDGTFSEVSGSVGLDFADDSRSFALADLDQDGRLEIVLKNRTAPQIRILRNALNEIGRAIAFRLQGTKSNRDAIGAAVTVEAAGKRQTKLLQAGSGFLSQHSKELFFGIARTEGPVKASIRWPSGLRQTLDELPANHRIEVWEGVKEFRAKPFGGPARSYLQRGEPFVPKALPERVETWLIQPLPAPDFSLPDLAGQNRTLSAMRGKAVLLYFWATAEVGSVNQLRLLQENRSTLEPGEVQIFCVNLDDPQKTDSIREFAAKEKFSLPIVMANKEAAGIYDLFFRYLFDRRRDLGVPTAFLLNPEGMVVKVYQGAFSREQLAADVREMPKTRGDFETLALPMKGTAYQAGFQRNDFTYGVAFYQRGYLDAAAAAFEAVMATKPDNPESYYNLGTLYLTKNALKTARGYLEQAVKLRPEYAEAWNNLGMVSAQQGQEAEAIEEFQKSLQFRPTYVTALLNYGNLLRRKGDFAGAEKLLEQAVKEKPEDADANYSMGMLLARQEQLPQASEFLKKAIELRPDYADALNNLGVLLVQQGKYSEAQEKFQNCIRMAPQFDQAYLNLARLYVVLNEKEKARQILQTLLQLQPGHKLAQQALAMLN